MRRRLARKTMCRTLLLILLMAMLCLPAAASVLTTTDPVPGQDAIYVAGNPDLFPIEYYNEDTGCYEGILPMMLERISQETGITFCYVSAGKNNQQLQLAKNSQVEMLSAYVPNPDTEPFLADTQIIIQVPVDGVQTDVCIAFTGIASQDLIQAVSSGVCAISAAELNRMILTVTMDRRIPNNQIHVIVILAGCLVLALVGILLVLVITRKKLRSLQNDGLTDKTTNIGNKVYFEKYYNSFLTDQNRSLYYVAYLAFDIRWANQYLGYDAAEQILRTSADTLMQFTRDTDIAARISGGSFALAFQSTNQDAAKEHILQLLDRLNRNMPDKNLLFRAGIYVIGHSNPTYETVLSNAEQAYLRSTRTKDPLVICTDQLIKDLTLERQIQEHVSDAIRNREFIPYIQLLVDCRTHQIRGGEIVSRWINPKTGLLFPGSYIDVMEESGAVVELDLIMFEQACRLLEGWSKNERADWSLSCNFSRLTISQPDFAQRLFSIASGYSFPRERLILEITEDTMESNKEMALRNSKLCRKHGFRLALDDMGKGYTSFTNLCEYPIDLIKIDRSIIENAVTRPEGPIVVDAMVTLAHRLGMKVVCEGVESEEQDIAARKAGADYVQGYRYCRPLPLEELDRFVREYQRSLSE